MKFIVICFFVFISTSIATAQQTQALCISNKNGSITTRVKCKAGETKLSANGIASLAPRVTLGSLLSKCIAASQSSCIPTNTGTTLCTVACPTGYMILSSSGVSLDANNYSVGHQPALAYENSVPTAYAYSFANIRQSGLLLLNGTCCPLN